MQQPAAVKTKYDHKESAAGDWQGCAQRHMLQLAGK